MDSSGALKGNFEPFVLADPKADRYRTRDCYIIAFTWRAQNIFVLVGGITVSEILSFLCWISSDDVDGYKYICFGYSCIDFDFLISGVIYAIIKKIDIAIQIYEKKKFLCIIYFDITVHSRF